LGFVLFFFFSLSFSLSFFATATSTVHRSGGKIKFERGAPKLTLLSKSGSVLEVVSLDGQQDVVKVLEEYGVLPQEISSSARAFSDTSAKLKPSRKPRSRRA
jgi:hypothetical protein